ncbi:MAG TPA: hypothetical protein VNU97_15275 [Rhizomicrobium sp.]|jgi:hypothetical protein|nr:hypothetical protein [Rhizomicrobium sp.]
MNKFELTSAHALAILAASIVTYALIYFVFFDRQKSPTEMACETARNAFADQARVPSSVNFPDPCDKDSIIQQDDGTTRVSGRVDATGVDGVTRHMHYIVYMEQNKFAETGWHVGIVSGDIDN